MYVLIVMDREFSKDRFGFGSGPFPPLERSTLKNHQKWQKFGKKWRKAMFNLRSTIFSYRFCKNPIPETRPITLKVYTDSSNSMYIYCFKIMMTKMAFKNAILLRHVFQEFNRHDCSSSPGVQVSSIKLETCIKN